MMVLPFLIDDGHEVRPCEARDLEIMYHFALSYDVYSNERHWYGLRKKDDNVDLLYVLRVALRAIRYTSLVLPPGAITGIRVVDSFNIYKVKCKKLHEFSENKLISLVIK